MTIETKFDIPLIAGLALREKQIQQNYRPIIAVHKWFARRPGTLFRALTLAEFGDSPLADIYFTANDFPGRKVADPFMGGGTPLIEANRVGCDVTGFDINPMATWIVREEIEHLDVHAYQAEASRLLGKLRAEIGDLYLTDCPLYGDGRRAREVFSLGEDDRLRVMRQADRLISWISPVRGFASSEERTGLQRMWRAKRGGRSQRTWSLPQLRRSAPFGRPNRPRPLYLFTLRT